MMSAGSEECVGPCRVPCRVQGAGWQLAAVTSGGSSQLIAGRPGGGGQTQLALNMGVQCLGVALLLAGYQCNHVRTARLGSLTCDGTIHAANNSGGGQVDLGSQKVFVCRSCIHALE